MTTMSPPKQLILSLPNWNWEIIPSENHVKYLHTLKHSLVEFVCYVIHTQQFISPLNICMIVVMNLHLTIARVQ